MAQRSQFDDIIFEIPEAYKIDEGIPPSTSKRKRSGASEDMLDDDVLLEALAEEHDLSVEKTVLLSRHPDFRKRSAGASPEDTRVKVSVSTEADEQAVILIEEDGVYRWTFPNKDAEKRSSKRSKGKIEHVFEIELAGYGHEPERRRGIGDKVKAFAKKVKAHVIKIRDAANVTNLTIKRLERKVTQCILNLKVDGGETDLEVWEPLQSLASLKLPAGRAPKVLLLIHGTFSSTVGSYGGLCKTPEGQAFLNNAHTYYDLVLGFDHFTLSETPAENAWELLKYLKTGNWSRSHPPIIDAVGYSRGGLVLRSLIERELPDDNWKAKVRKAVFVGATNGGTALAKPENWYRFIDFYTNMAAASTRVVSLVAGGGLAGPIFTGMIRGLGAFAKYLATASVTKAKIPGLSAMEPGGPFVTEINRTQKGQPSPDDIDYYAVTSDFDIKAIKDGPSPGIPKRMLLSLGGGMMEQLMGEANDLVVNTASMTTIDPDLEGLVKQVRAFGKNGQVYHTVYFLQPATVRALQEWFELPGKIPSKSKSKSKQSGSSKRQVLTTTDEPVVFVPVEPIVQHHLPQPAVPMHYGAVVREKPQLKVSVHWDDITKADGDAYAVGHYRGVEPQSAELAVDHHISRVSWGLPWEERQKSLVLTRLTRQGLLIGDIGQVDLFPWGDGSHRVATICGMGFFNGDFSEQNVQLLYRKLVWKLNTIPDMKTLCTVLIGSGVGSLDTRRALRGQLSGYADALAAFTDMEHRIQEVKIVEYDKLKAQEIYDNLLTISRQDEIELNLIIDDKVQSKGTGRVSEEHALSLVLGSILQTFKLDPSSKRMELLDAYLSNSGIKSVKKRELMPRLFEAWSNLEAAAGDKARNIELASSDAPSNRKELDRRIKQKTRDLLTETGLSRTISVKLSAGVDEKSAIPNRLSIRLQDNVYRIAGLTSSSAVPEREIRVDVKLVQELIERMTDPDAETAHQHGKLLYQLLIPGEFEELLTSSSSLVFELDRNTAPIHWEMLVFPSREQTGAVGLTLPVSRQLRTTYSNIPSARSDRIRRALVIGNPDGTLDFARDEALVVHKQLTKHGFEVDTFIGSPDDLESGVEGFPPANRLDVVGKLFESKYAIVHYAGHGDYDKENPSKTGWLFTSGLLTAGEMERLKDAPALIFANACLSSRTSRATVGAEEALTAQSKRLGQPFGEAGLLPSLADEVLKLGVRNYIGTAWEIDDKGAILFAESFYDNFLNGASIGDAIYKARKKLCRHVQYGALWAAYQHYGPPDYVIESA